MPTLIRPRFYIEVDWTDTGDPTLEWPTVAGYPPADLMPFRLQASVGSGARSVDDLSVTDLAFSALVAGGVRLVNTGSEFTVGEAGRDATYDTALQAPHLVRFRGPTLDGRDVMQLGRGQIVSADGQEALFDVRPRFTMLHEDPQVTVSQPGASQAATLARHSLDDANTQTGLPAPPVEALVEPDEGGGVGSVLVGTTATARADLNPATVQSVLSQWANVLCGWWQERWDGGVALYTYILQKTRGQLATITPEWLPDADRSRAGRVYGMVRNQALTRGPTTGARFEAINRVYRLSQILAGVAAPSEVVRWSDSPALGEITGVSDWGAPEFLVYVDDAWWDVWVPDATEWDGMSTVTTGTDAEGNFSRQTLTTVRMAQATWIQIRADYAAANDGETLQTRRVDIVIEFGPRVTRSGVGEVTIPTASDMSARADEIRASQAQYLRQMPVLADTTNTNTTFENGALAFDTLYALRTPPRVAVLDLPMQYPATLDMAPHQLRTGDRLDLNLPGLAQWPGIAVGILRNWDVEQRIRLVVIETGGIIVVAPDRMAAPTAVSNAGGEAVVTWTASTSLNVTHYEVRYSQDNGQTWVLHHLDIDFGTDTVTLDGLDAGDYLFQVRASVNNTNGPWSPSSASVEIAAPPLRFTDLVIGSATNDPTIDAQMDWIFGDQSSIILPSETVDSTASIYLYRLVVSYTFTQFSRWQPRQVGTFVNTQMLDSWETLPVAATLLAGGLSFQVPGPDNAGNRTRSSAAPYAWRMADAKRTEFQTFQTAWDALSQADKDATILRVHYP